MKASGSTIFVEEKAMNATPTTTPTSANSSQNLGEKACTNGAMAKFTTASGTKASNMAMESGKASMETAILASGRIPELTATVSILGATVTATKVSGNNASSTEMALTFSPTETSILAITRTENLMATGSTSGQTEAVTLGTSKTDSNMAKGSGNRRKEQSVILTKANTTTTSNKAKASSGGPVAMSILAGTKTMKETVMEK